MVLGILRGCAIWTRFHYCIQVAEEYAGSCQWKVFLHKTNS